MSVLRPYLVADVSTRRLEFENAGLTRDAECCGDRDYEEITVMISKASVAYHSNIIVRECFRRHQAEYRWLH